MAGGPKGTIQIDTSNRECAARTIWAYSFLVAIRENATSIHFHPWLKGESMSYFNNNGGQKYCIFPPPASMDRALLASASRLLGASKPRKLFSSGSCSGDFSVEHCDSITKWSGVVWKSKVARGVEFYRIREATLNRDADWKACLENLTNSNRGGNRWTYENNPRCHPLGISSESLHRSLLARFTFLIREIACSVPLHAWL